MQKVVTHSGSFDPDDVLAVAAVQLYLGEENVTVVRSRQQEVIAAADWVIDVGGVYDPTIRRFDHHQNGVPKRENGVPYSALGLVWREIGEELCGSAEVSVELDRRLVQPIDAADNHVTVCHPGAAGLAAFELFDVIDTLKPVWGSEETFDQQFVHALTFARNLIQRLIAHSVSHRGMRAMISDCYEASTVKTVLSFDTHVPRHALIDFIETQVVVSPVPARDVGHWMAAVVPVQHRGFQNRAVFPEIWAGLSHEDLEDVCGIDGSVFCHKERYIFVAETKEAALKAAHHARP